MGIQVSKTIQADREAVFDACSDFARAADRVEGIVNVDVLTDGPIGVGTRFRETRVMFGKEATEEMEVTRFDPGQAYTVEATSCGAHYVTNFDFSEDNGQTHVTMDMQVQPLTLMAKLMSPLGWMMSGFMKKCLLKDLDDIALYLEGKSSVAT